MKNCCNSLLLATDVGELFWKYYSVLHFTAVPEIHRRSPPSTKGIWSAENVCWAKTDSGIECHTTGMHHEWEDGICEVPLELYLWSDTPLATEAWHQSAGRCRADWWLAVPCREATTGDACWWVWFTRHCCERNSAAACRYIGKINSLFYFAFVIIRLFLCSGVVIAVNMFKDIVKIWRIVIVITIFV